MSKFCRKPLVSHVLFQEMKIIKDFDRIKRNVMYYRFIFIALGILFSFLTAKLYFHSPNWNFNLIFTHGSLAKELITGISALLTVLTLWIGCHSRTSIELAKHYKRRAELEIKRIYNSKKKQKKKDHIQELRDNLQLSLEDIENAYKNTTNHINYINELPLSDTAKRQIKLMHLKNLYFYLEDLPV